MPVQNTTPAVGRIVSQASTRMVLNRFMQTACWVLAGAGVVLILARVVERVLGLAPYFEGNWGMLIGAGAGVAVLAAAIWSLATAHSRSAVARVVDERAGTREALSTSMLLGSRNQDPWASAVVQSAETVAARLNAKALVPFELPKAWFAPLSAAIAMLIVWYAVPSMDLLKVLAKHEEKKQRQEQLVQVTSEVAADKKKLQELMKHAKVDTLVEPGVNEAVPEQKVDVNDPESIRRAAMKELTSLTEKLEQAKLSEKAQQSEALKEAMSQLKKPGPGPLDEFAKSLSKGDFAAAKAALDEVSRQAGENALSNEQQQQMKEQMENLSKQLDKLAKDQKQLTKELEKAGLDKKTAQELAQKAGDPAELQKALEQLKQMSPEQQKKLMEMAKSASQSQSQCQNMSQAMSKASKGMSQQGLNQEAMQGMEQLAQELSAAEVMQSDMENLEAALKECQGQMAKLGNKLGGQCDNPGGGDGDKDGESQGYSKKLGEWRSGDSKKQGKGSGGPGRGNGAGPEEAPTDFTLEKKKADVKTTAGPIIGSRLVYGQQVRGESVAQFSDAVASAQQAAAEGIDNQQVPRELENAVKAYFGRLEEKASQPAQQSKDTPPAPKQ